MASIKARITALLSRLSFRTGVITLCSAIPLYIASVAQLACENSDVIYIPTDNTAAANTEAIANVVLPAKVPVVAGEAGICGGCGIATLSIDYYDLGYATGLMAAKILKGEANVAEMPIEFAPEVTKTAGGDECRPLLQLCLYK